MYQRPTLASPTHGLWGSLDMTLFDFLEQYMKRLEGPLGLQVWNRFLQLGRDLLVSLREFRPQAFAALRYAFLSYTVASGKPNSITSGVSPFSRTRFPKRQRWTTSAYARICKRHTASSSTSVYYPVVLSSRDLGYEEFRERISSRMGETHQRLHYVVRYLTASTFE